MCGIVGIVDIKNKVKHGIEYINSIQNHRGPDEFGIFKKQSIGLSMAMTRLSIVGVQEAHQPYVSTDGYVVTFNGEIFNEKSLYKDRKITVPTGSTHNYEAELICLLYKKYGNSFLDKLNGMFSIAVYDPKRNTILLARDRFGIKPLYYLHNQRVFCYSSEIQPLIECLEKKVSINDQSVYNYFSVGYIPNPETIYSEIDQVKPGCIVELNMDTHRVSSSRWWRLNYNYNYNFSIDEWYENINYQLDDSVKKWGNSDVPITYLLSGGIDSSSIVALAAQRSSGPINTYSLGFDGEGESQWSELSIARKVSNKYCTNHTEIILNPGDLADSLYAMNKHLEQPYSGGLPSWAVFKEISKKLTKKKKIESNFYWIDERCVLPNSKESNFKTANDYLFNKINIDEKNIYRIIGENNPDDEQKRYTELLENNLFPQHIQ